MGIVLTPAISFILVIMHELGHLASAKLLKLKIQGFGYQIRPLPSFFVSVERCKSKWKNLIYLLSGNIITLLVLLVINCKFKEWWGMITIPFYLQIIGEYNPFYSDLVLILSNIYIKERNVKDSINSYYRSYRFLMLLTLWLFIIIYIFKIGL